MKFILSIALCLLCFAGSIAQNKPNPWPLSISENGRYFLDKENKPYWINGDAAWSLLVQPTLADAKKFMEQRAKQGINAMLVNILEKKYSDRAPATTEGEIYPFLEPGNFGKPNPAYFKRLDTLLNIAKENGITLYLFPLYLGYLNAGDGFYEEIAKTDTSTIKTYASFLANRYKSQPNIVWMIGGDHNPEKAMAQLTIAAKTIKAIIPNAIMTAHCHPGISPRVAYNDPDWLNLSQVYDYGIIHTAIGNMYQAQPVKPFVMLESTYENEWESTPQQIRRQAWWSICGGAAGTFMGNFPVWHMAKGWLDQWETAAAKSMTVLAEIASSTEWYAYQPDRKREVLVRGWGEGHGTNLAGFMAGETGALGYFPDVREIEILLPKSASIKWIDPSNGTMILSEDHNSGKHTLMVPGKADAVLLIAYK